MGTYVRQDNKREKKSREFRGCSVLVAISMDGSAAGQRVVALIDLDCFYCAVAVSYTHLTLPTILLV